MEYLLHIELLLAVLAFSLEKAVSKDPCTHTIILEEPWRSVENAFKFETHCDKDNLNPDIWYQFTIDGNAAEIPTTCVKTGQCGTKIGLRVELEEQTMPGQPGETITAVLCGSYDVLGKYDCCVLRSQVEIARCPGDIFVYKFPRSFDRCPMSVCTVDSTVDIPALVLVKHGEDITYTKSQEPEPVDRIQQEDDPSVEEEKDTATTNQEEQGDSDIQTLLDLLDLTALKAATTVSADIALSSNIDENPTTQPTQISTTGVMHLPVVPDISYLETPNAASNGSGDDSSRVIIDDSEGSANDNVTNTHIVKNNTITITSAPYNSTMTLSTEPVSININNNNTTLSDSVQTTEVFETSAFSDEQNNTLLITSTANMISTDTPSYTSYPGNTRFNNSVVQNSSSLLPHVTTELTPTMTINNSFSSPFSHSSLSSTVVTSEPTTTLPSSILTSSSQQTPLNTTSPSPPSSSPPPTSPSSTSSTSPSSSPPSPPPSSSSTPSTSPTSSSQPPPPSSSSTPSTSPTSTSTSPTSSPPTVHHASSSHLTVLTHSTIQSSTTGFEPDQSSTEGVAFSSTPLPQQPSNRSQTTTPADHEADHDEDEDKDFGFPNDVVLFEKVRLVFKHDFENDPTMADHVITKLNHFLLAATRLQKSKSGTNWWFELKTLRQPFGYRNMSTVLDVRIKHTAGEEILHVFERYDLKEYFQKQLNLTLIAECRPSQKCEKLVDINTASKSDTLPSILGSHTHVIIALVVVAVLVISVLLLALWAKKCFTRGWRRGSYNATRDDYGDYETKPLSKIPNVHSVLVGGGLSSPFTDDQIIGHEKQHGEMTTSFTDNEEQNGRGDIHTWVIPLNEALTHTGNGYTTPDTFVAHEITTSPINDVTPQSEDVSTPDNQHVTPETQESLSTTDLPESTTTFERIPPKSHQTEPPESMMRVNSPEATVTVKGRGQDAYVCTRF